MNHFLLAGNGPYSNRGCEAIVRGTVRILRHAFGESIRVTVASFGTHEDIRQQASEEHDSDITHLPLEYARFSVPWAADQLGKRLGIRTSGFDWILGSTARRVGAALCVGGDNYSLDYGIPVAFLALDDTLLRRGVPLFLWGASVGPFTADPEFAHRMYRHLNRFDGVFVRESKSLAYLGSNGIRRATSLMADPAFVMDPVEPPAAALPSGLGTNEVIGLNFSPLMAKYVTGGNMEAWETVSAAATVELLRRAQQPVILIPHVFQPHINNDDGEFLHRLADRVRSETREDLPVVQKLPSAQLKWIISKCSIFAGARTHTTIASFSSQVPTVSLAYSVKAVGLTRDIYDADKFCVPRNGMTVEAIATAVANLFQQRHEVREHLARRIPIMKEKAFAAGNILRAHLEHRNSTRTSSEPAA